MGDHHSPSGFTEHSLFFQSALFEELKVKEKWFPQD